MTEKEVTNKEGGRLEWVSKLCKGQRVNSEALKVMTPLKCSRTATDEIVAVFQ